MRATSALLILLVLAPLGARAAALPEALGEFVRTSLEVVRPAEADRALQEEFGLEEGEQAVYETPSGERADIFAWRYYDDTGAYSAYLWKRPAGGELGGYGKRAWQSPSGILIQFGNYVVEISGDTPDEDNIELMLTFLPRVRISVDPPVLQHVPSELVIPGSERHILGPVGLKALAPEIAPSVAGFHFDAEAQFARYDIGEGEQRMLLFAYPTPQMARAQAEMFYEIEDVVAKRSGPVIGVVVAPVSPDEAQRLLAKVRYEAEVTMNYADPARHDNVGTLILDVMILSGILALLSIVGGVLVAVARILAGRVAPKSIFAAPEGDGLTHLDIDVDRKV